MFKYGSMKGFKKICKMESLNEILMNFDDIEKKYTCPDGIINGVSTIQLELFCKKTSTAMYAWDSEYQYFHMFYPENLNQHAPTLMF
jgi:hypothetical protein